MKRLYCWLAPHEWVEGGFKTFFVCKNCLLGCKYKPEFLEKLRRGRK